MVRAEFVCCVGPVPLSLSVSVGKEERKWLWRLQVYAVDAVEIPGPGSRYRNDEFACAT